LEKKILSGLQGTRVIKLQVSAPDICRKALPGQFVVLMAAEEGERIPLTIVDKDIDKSVITLIFQEAGLTTQLLGKMEAGDSLYALVGPLGHATEIKNYGKVILAGGGVGIAEIYPVARAFKDAGNQITCVLGARAKELLILENELKKISDEFFVTTDDGSYGRKGFTTDVVAELLKQGKYGIVYAVGPLPMMKRTAQVTREFPVKTIVSLNAIMVDGTGMCGCCRVSVGGVTKFSCVDGPEFDAAQVDWDELSKRNNIYREQEKHICSLLK
jgi:ferredoxin--NADP+ reductase